MPLSRIGPSIDGPPRPKLTRARSGPDSVGAPSLQIPVAHRAAASADPLLVEESNLIEECGGAGRRRNSDACGEKEFMIAITKRLQSFQESRDEERKRNFHVVMTSGFAVSVAGLLLLFVAMPVRDLYFRALGHVGTALGSCCFGVGVVLLSTCPAEQVDVDELFRASPRLRVSVGLGLALVNGVGGFVSPPHIRVLAAIAALGLVCGSLEAPPEPDRVLSDGANSTHITAEANLRIEQMRQHWPDDKIRESPKSHGKSGHAARHGPHGPRRRRRRRRAAAAAGPGPRRRRRRRRTGQQQPGQQHAADDVHAWERAGRCARTTGRADDGDARRRHDGHGAKRHDAAGAGRWRPGRRPGRRRAARHDGRPAGQLGRSAGRRRRRRLQQPAAERRRRRRRRRRRPRRRRRRQPAPRPRRQAPGPRRALGWLFGKVTGGHSSSDERAFQL